MRLAGKLALVVDDDADARELVSRALKSIGMDVRLAENGAEALKKVSRWSALDCVGFVDAGDGWL